MGILRIVLTTLYLGVFLSGCLAESPQEREPSVQGDYEDGNEQHRPGQPCLLCHSADGHFPKAPGGKTFVLGGTIYATVDANENDGLRDVEVVFTDARGDEFTALTNRSGNFLVEVDSGLDQPRQKSKGVLKVPRNPLFPLEVIVRRDGIENKMHTKIWRNGSCAHCHGPSLARDSVGRVYLAEEEP